MKNSEIIFRKLRLQLLADGDGVDGGTGAEGTVPGVQKGVTGNPFANVRYGVQPAEEPAEQIPTAQKEEAAVNEDDEFEKLIKGRFKDQYGKKVKAAVDDRFKNQKDQSQKISRQDPIIAKIAAKYGVAADDYDALEAAMEEESEEFSNEAMRLGRTLDEHKAIRTLERENNKLKGMLQDTRQREQFDQKVEQWKQDAENVGMKLTYPSFDLMKELKNEKYMSLLMSGIDVQTAFEVVHMHDIVPAAMQYSAQTVESKLAKSMASNMARPMENGSSSSAIIKSDVSKLNREDRREINRRVAAGERISFG